MLNAVIRSSLRQPVLVLFIALLLVIYGAWKASFMPVDVFPDLNRPRVVIMTEAPGMAPEEVESLVTFPIETIINGATGVEAVRSSSGVGLSIVYVDFAYGTDIFIDRQIVAERMQIVSDRLPKGVTPQLSPMSSIMGQILTIGIWGDSNLIDPMELRTIADWVIRQRLLTVPGVSQIFTMGGERRQFQVLVNPEALRRFDITLREVEEAIEASNENGAGGYLDRQGPNELMVRSLGRIQVIEDIEKIPVRVRDGRAVRLSQVAEVTERGETKRGDSSVFTRLLSSETMESSNAQDDSAWKGGAAVVLTINKQPGADTRRVTEDVMRAISELKSTLPPGLRILPVYSQKDFIDRAIANVVEALRDGVILVVIVLFMFLMNVRTTFITMTAIPLSLVATATVFAIFGLSINTMTLGGLAVAMGELVDDAIVDVENIFRRLKENRVLREPRHPLVVVYEASVEVRSSIIYSTAIVVIAFVPLFAMGGMEGKLFVPLGIAYVVSILASLAVSLTVTPVLSYALLGKQSSQKVRGDSLVLSGAKWIASHLIRFSLRFPVGTLLIVLMGVMIAAFVGIRLDRDFLPPFNEGTVQLNVVLKPGVSLAESNAVCQVVENSLKQIGEVERFARRTGRAELDEHAEGVNISEFLIELNPQSVKTRAEQIAEIRNAMEEIPGIVTAVEQPIAHLISHMLSGVKSQVSIKIFGDDLDLVRQKSSEMRMLISEVPGVQDLMVEPQVLIEQLRIELDRDKLLTYGIHAKAVTDYVETAMNGKVVTEVLQGRQTIDLLIRFQDEFREDIESLKRLSVALPGGGQVPLSSLASIYLANGPNVVNHDHGLRRVGIQCNVVDRGVVDVVHDIQQVLLPLISALPPGYFVEYGGQFQSQKKASRTIAALFLVSLSAIFVVLFTMLRSVNLSLQVMVAIPMAFIGSVAALVITEQTVTIAAMVGFVSLAGIASRNGILLLNHYLHLVRYEGEELTKEMIVRAGLERVSPVLMTALASGIALIPLILSSEEPGKELLYPIATVILGGLISATLLDFLVHPALFWLFGLHATKHLLERTPGDDVLV